MISVDSIASHDQVECLVPNLVKALLICFCCSRPRCRALLEMGSNYALVSCFQYLLTCSAGGTSKFAKDSQLAGGICLCLGSMWLPGLLSVKCNTQIGSFLFLLQWGSSFVVVPASCFGDRVNKVVEDLSLLTATHHFSAQLLSWSATNCIQYVAVVACFLAPHHQMVCLLCCFDVHGKL